MIMCQFILIYDQDVMKTCWNMYQVMHDDPRRRFVHAFTIENTTTRLWFASRSEILVSEPFNFMTVSALSFLIIRLVTSPHH